MRPLVNVDYFLAATLSSFLGTVFNFLFLFFLLVNDLMINLAPIYHFKIHQVFQSLRDILHMDWTYFLPTGIGLLGLMILITWCAVRFTQTKRYSLKNAVLILSLGFFAFFADVLNGSSFIQMPVQISYVNFNIAYSGLKRTTSSLRNLPYSNKLVFESLPSQSSAVGRFLSWKKGKISGPRRQIALIVVESMGSFNDPVLDKSLFKEFFDPNIQKKYQVAVGRVPFSGHTEGGELRELCGINPLSSGTTEFPVCLPAVLKRNGFETIAFHGFSSQFYNRFQWYPLLGFEKMYFAHHLYQQGIKKKCGSAFRGLCDTDVSELLHQELLRTSPEKPKFVYWLTLNSHLPLDTETSRSSSFDCSEHPLTRNYQDVCVHTRTIDLVLGKIAEIAKDPNLPLTEFIVVGDHAPPFFDPTQRGFYSQADVPYISLKPRSL